MIDPSLLKAFITMMAAVGGLSLLLFILKKKAHHRSVHIDPSLQTLSIDSRVNVSPKSQVAVVKYGEKKYLLGISEQSINLIADVSEKPAHVHADNPIPASSGSAIHSTDISPNDISFAAFIKSITKRDFNKN